MAGKTWKMWLLRFCGFLGLVLLANPAAKLAGLTHWLPLVNNQTMKVHLYQRDSLRPDILFLGTSKINRAVIPGLVEKELSGNGAGPVTAFCLGQPGVSAYAQRLVLRDVLETNGSPRLMVLEVTPATLNANHGCFRDVLRYYASQGDLVRATPRLRTAAEWQAAGRGAFRGMTSLYLHAWCRLFFGEREGQLASIRRRKGGTYGISSPEGTQRLSELSAEERQELLRLMRQRGRGSFMRRYRIGGAATEGIDEIIRLVRMRGIGLVLLNPPVTPAYRRALYRREEYAQYLEYIRAISRREKIPFHDLDDGRFNFTAADFYDFGHLNRAGARRVSRYLAAEILGPALHDPPVPAG